MIDTTSPTDDQLVARVRSGSDEAFAAIVRRHREPLLGFAARLLGGSHHDAEDVVQDAFIRALPALRATDRPMALRSWLHMIVRNRAMDHLRAPARRRSDGDEALALVALPGADPADRAVERERLARVVAGIGRLPERQRLALVRRELCGDSHEQLAGSLGSTVPATKSLLVRARAALAEAEAEAA